MNFSFYEGPLPQVAADILALGAFQNDDPDLVTPGAWVLEAFEAELATLLQELAREEDFKGKSKQNVILHTHGRIGAKRIVLLGLGKREDFDLPDMRRYGAGVLGLARKSGARSVAIVLPPIDPYAAERASQFLAEGVGLAAYQYDRFVEPDRREPLKVAEVAVVLPPELEGSAPHLALARAQVVVAAVNLARDLTNDPPSELTPSKLAEVAQGLAKDRALECKVLGPKEIERQKMRLLLAVSRGSAEEPRFIHLTYRPKGKESRIPRIVLVGKGITFDSGGLSLKPSASMVDMKCDMAGAAVVLGVMQALPSLGLQCEVHALVAATENMLSASAYKLGDILTAMNGKTIEVTNTDAEGRLTLADALVYGVKLEPDELIDLATLTGACMVALGPHMAGVMGNNLSAVERFLAAARRAGEEAWSLPLPVRLRDQLESPIADLKNSGERWGGALVAGLFLKEFVGDVPWIHVDIAGPAFAEKAWNHLPRGGTGFGVATLLDYLLSRDTRGAG